MSASQGEKVEKSRELSFTLQPDLTFFSYSDKLITAGRSLSHKLLKILYKMY